VGEVAQPAGSGDEEEAHGECVREEGGSGPSDRRLRSRRRRDVGESTGDLRGGAEARHRYVLGVDGSAALADELLDGGAQMILGLREEALTRCPLQAQLLIEPPEVRRDRRRFVHGVRPKITSSVRAKLRHSDT
jgi:hypothetical protein